jgi:hypothetical protein
MCLECFGHAASVEHAADAVDSEAPEGTLTVLVDQLLESAQLVRASRVELELAALNMATHTWPRSLDSGLAYKKGNDILAPEEQASNPNVRESAFLGHLKLTLNGQHRAFEAVSARPERRDGRAAGVDRLSPVQEMAALSSHPFPSGRASC